MYDGTRELVKSLLAVPALIAAFFVVVAAFYAIFSVFSLGPAGLFVVVFVGIAVMATKTWLGGDDDESRATRRRNCPTCGAPNPADADDCGYCGGSLEGP